MSEVKPKITPQSLRVSISAARQAGKTSLTAVLVKLLEKEGILAHAIYSDTKEEEFNLIFDHVDELIENFKKANTQILFFDSDKDIPTVEGMFGGVGPATDLLDPIPTQASNFTYVSPNAYIVRTQAGYEQAFKDWMRYVGYGDDGIKKYMKEAEGFPTIYPSLVTFSMCYRGYDYVECTSLTFDTIKGAIAESDAQYFKSIGKEVVETDVVHLTNENLRLKHRMTNVRESAKNNRRMFQLAENERFRAERRANKLHEIVKTDLDELYAKVEADPTCLATELMLLKDKVNRV